jgi:hypothetical protein
LSVLKPVTTCEAVLQVFMLQHSVLLLIVICSLASAAVCGSAGKMSFSVVTHREVAGLRHMN